MGRLARYERDLWPAGITLAVLLLLIGVTLRQAGGDPLVFATLGSRYAQGMEGGSDGYDGQFVYYIARTGLRYWSVRIWMRRHTGISGYCTHCWYEYWHWVIQIGWDGC